MRVEVKIFRDDGTLLAENVVERVEQGNRLDWDLSEPLVQGESALIKLHVIAETRSTSWRRGFYG